MQPYAYQNLIVDLFSQVRAQHHYNGNKEFTLSPNNALWLSVEVSADNNGYEINGNTRNAEWVRRWYGECHFLISSWHKLFVARSDRKVFSFKDIPIDTWRNVSNHDSCWGEGVKDALFQESYDAYDHCFGFMPQEHMRDKSHDANIEYRLGNIGGRTLRFAEIEFEQDVSRDQNGYWKTLTKVTELEPVLSFQPRG